MTSQRACTMPGWNLHNIFPSIGQSSHYVNRLEISLCCTNHHERRRIPCLQLRPDSLTVVTFYILETVICSSPAKHLENTYLGHSYYSSLLMTSRNTYSYRQLVYLQMTVYYTEIFKMKLTRNYFRKTWVTYSDGNLTGKWSFISVNSSFYVLPKNLDHLPQFMTYRKSWNFGVG